MAFDVFPLGIKPGRAGIAASAQIVVLLPFACGILACEALWLVRDAIPNERGAIQNADAQTRELWQRIRALLSDSLISMVARCR
ncbi:hypothetical protein C7974DRAFT_392038 [Boeremia exigua]|uniref:uncharacterized protein n=1 Tax=Boeremia exigua TaxID=749465 RepID=UPI001E8D2F01|nr:uncharacterized protein C7974DRAFT_392038 [Boeremia exigua]KAH6633058.1 hypothetical protein C7974DRAFT_392038 [Boeremia exigua]